MSGTSGSRTPLGIAVLEDAYINSRYPFRIIYSRKYSEPVFLHFQLARGNLWGFQYWFGILGVRPDGVMVLMKGAREYDSCACYVHSKQDIVDLMKVPLGLC